MTAWVVVLAVGACTIALKAAGPVLIGGRELPDRVARGFELLAPAVLAALVVTQTFGSGGKLVVDERVIGVAAAAVAIRLRAPLIAVMVIAAAVTAVARLVLS